MNKKWLTIGLLIALVNPIFSGLIIGTTYLTEPNLKKEGRIVLIFTLIWAVIIAIFLKNRYG